MLKTYRKKKKWMDSLRWEKLMKWYTGKSYEGLIVLEAVDDCELMLVMARRRSVFDKQQLIKTWWLAFPKRCNWRLVEWLRECGAFIVACEDWKVGGRWMILKLERHLWSTIVRKWRVSSACCGSMSLPFSASSTKTVMPLLFIVAKLAIRTIQPHLK